MMYDQILNSDVVGSFNHSKITIFQWFNDNLVR